MKALPAVAVALGIGFMLGLGWARVLPDKAEPEVVPITQHSTRAEIARHFRLPAELQAALIEVVQVAIKPLSPPVTKQPCGPPGSRPVPCEMKGDA